MSPTFCGNFSSIRPIVAKGISSNNSGPSYLSFIKGTGEYFEGSHSSSSKVFVLLSKRCKSKSSDLDDISSTSTVAKKQI